MKTSVLFGTAITALALCSCSPLSDEAKEMVGNYYINEVSVEKPVLELRDDGTVLQHAIKPGVLSYAAKGTWNVERDTLFIEFEPQAIDIVGDPTLVGSIPKHLNRAIIDFNGITLTLRSEGADYIYHRRGSVK